MKKREELKEIIDQCIKEGFTGNIQINFDQGRINNRVNVYYTRLLIDKSSLI